MQHRQKNRRIVVILLLLLLLLAFLWWMLGSTLSNVLPMPENDSSAVADSSNLQEVAALVQARMSDDGSIFRDRLYWQVYRADESGNRVGPVLHAEEAAELNLRQLPGFYIVTAGLSGSETLGEMLVGITADDRSDHILDLRSGTIVLRATIDDAPGQPGQYWDLIWHAYPLFADGSSGTRISSRVTDNTVPDKAVRMVLPPANYRIEARFLVPISASRSTEVLVSAGQASEHTVPFNR